MKKVLFAFAILLDVIAFFCIAFSILAMVHGNYKATLTLAIGNCLVVLSNLITVEMSGKD